MCCVVLVSAGRNVLDSVPPTHRPPTHGRLCIYTSGSSCSPQSLRSFKSLPCIYRSALFLSFSISLLFPGACSSCNGAGTRAHTPKMQTHNAIDKNDSCVSQMCRSSHTNGNKWEEALADLPSNHVSCFASTADARPAHSRFPWRHVYLKTILEINQSHLEETFSFRNISQRENCCLIFPSLNSPQKVRGACNWNKWSPGWFQHSVSPICAYILCYR